MNPPNPHQSVRTFGRNMMLAFWIVLILLLALLFHRILDQQDNPNRKPDSRIDDQGVRQVTLERNRAGHYVADGEINGKPVTFLLDTGATYVAVPAKLAQRLGLAKGAEQLISTANGEATAWSTRLREVSIGTIKLVDVQAGILSSMEGGQVLLGMSFLQRLEMVQRDGRLTLRQFE
jgi:aspartyl protease family protein